MATPDPTLTSIFLTYGGIALTFVIPPCLAAYLSGFLVLRWKGRGDYLEERLDEICQMIDMAADLAADYWTIDQQNPNALLSEAKVQAQMMRIAGLRTLLETTMSGSSAREIRDVESAFLREATGGDFGVHNRVADPFRIVTIRHSAAEFIVAIRRARMRDLQGIRQRG